MKPIIGITSNTNRKNRRRYTTNATYIERIIEVGGLPLLIPSKIGLDDCRQIIQKIDGLLIPGGGDILPLLYNEEPHPKVTYTIKNEDLFEMELVKLAKKYDKPVLGICRGVQIINVAFGGDLYQDIPSQYKDEICHRQSRENTAEPMHRVYLTEDSILSKILDKSVIDVNTLHHQSVKDVAEGFNVVGKSADGVIEAIESKDGRIIGVQWHPEILAPKFKEFENLFRNFVEKSALSDFDSKSETYKSLQME